MNDTVARPARLAKQDLSQVGKILLWALHPPSERGPMPALDLTNGRLLVEAAGRHRVLALLHDALAEEGTLDTLPDEVSAELSRRRHMVTAQYLRVCSELKLVSAALRAAGLEWLVMKGPAVAQLGYEDPASRWFCDLDILVAPDHFGSAIDALVAVHASLVDLNWDLQLAMLRAEATLKLPIGTTLDLHWHPVNERRARASTHFDVAALLSRQRSLPSAVARALPVADSVDNMLLVAVHASFSGGHRLTWLKDIEALARRDPPDWDELVRRAAASNVALPVALMLRRAERLVGAQVPTDVVPALIGRHPWAQLSLIGERLANPVSLGRGAHTGIAVVSSLRGSFGASMSELARAGREHFSVSGRNLAERLGLHKPPGPLPPNPLWQPSSDPSSRARYLTAISGDGWPGWDARRSA